MREQVAHDDREFVEGAPTIELDWARLESYLAEQGKVFSSRAPVRQFARGFGNLKFLIEVDGERLVLRRPPPGPLPPGGNDMAREYRVLSRLWEVFSLAPRAVLMCEDKTVLGAPFFLMEYRPGLVVHSRLPDCLRGEGRELSESMVDTLVRLHAVRPEAIGLGDFGRPERFLARTVEGWIKRADVATDGFPPAAADELGEWLRDNAVPEGDVTLLHNDFKLNNFVLDPEHPVRPVALLDWDMCTRGDALFDLATLLSYWAEPGDPQPMLDLGQMPTATDGFLSREQVVERYAELTGRDLSDFIFHRVLAMFKLGVVFLQLYARYRRGATKDRRFKDFKKLAEGLLDFALEVAYGRAF